MNTIYISKLFDRSSKLYCAFNSIREKEETFLWNVNFKNISLGRTCIDNRQKFCFKTVYNNLKRALSSCIPVNINVKHQVISVHAIFIFNILCRFILLDFDFLICLISTIWNIMTSCEPLQIIFSRLDNNNH